MEHKRKCENWLADFMRWTLPRSEAKESYVFWTGLFTLASCLRRHVKISKEYLGSWEVYPYLYILFVGPAGSRKTTTTNYNIELLEEVSGLVPAPDQVTVPKLLSQLVEAEDNAMYINAGELSEFIAKSGLDTYGFLTKCFDGVRRLSAGTHLRGVELAEKPCINFLGATTGEWLSDNLPQSVLDGGFGSRTIMVHEETVRLRRLIYKDVINVKDLYEELFPGLVEDLNYIAHNLFGDFHMDKKTYTTLDEWYHSVQENQKNIKMAGYYERKPAHVMKVAMLLKIADGEVTKPEHLRLTWKDFEEAIATVEMIEPSLPKILKNFGRNPYKADIKSIFSFITARGTVMKSELMSEFFSIAEPRKLEELVNGLANAHMITLTPEGTDVIIATRNSNHS